MQYALVESISTLFKSVDQAGHTGDPKKDWVRIKRELRASDDNYLSEIASALDYLVAFNRGQCIASNLCELWLAGQSYAGARTALDSVLAQEQLLSGTDQLHGIHVMNMHKCKGKQFDGVILYRGQYSSPFVWPSDPPPHCKSRRILHVTITRARKHVLVLDKASSSCAIIDPHVL